MTTRQRQILGMRFEESNGEVRLVIRGTVGSETVVEDVPLGEISRGELIQLMEEALADLRKPTVRATTSAA